MKINIKQTSEIISKLVDAQLNDRVPKPAMIWGPPGLGKSDVVREIATGKEIEMRDIRLAQMDPVDLRGVPLVEKGKTIWATPDFLPQKQDSAGILFLDELSAVDSSIQVAAYQLILERRCGNYTLPPKWYVCAAGNRSGDNAVSLPISSALANRLLHLEVEPDPKAWCDWGVTHSIAPELIAFIRFRPEMLFQMDAENCERGWPSPRSWAGVSQILSIGLEGAELNACFIGLVGTNAAVQFLAFLKQSRTLGDIRTAMLDPKGKWKAPVKNDMLYAVATAIGYWLWRGESKAEEKKLMDGFFRISLQLPSTFAVVAMIDALESGQGDESAAAFAAHADFPQWQKVFDHELQKQRGCA